jgi:hypothetical protein
MTEDLPASTPSSPQRLGGWAGLGCAWGACRAQGSLLCALRQDGGAQRCTRGVACLAWRTDRACCDVDEPLVGYRCAPPSTPAGVVFGAQVRAHWPPPTHGLD